jgi:hypothetical protein
MEPRCSIGLCVSLSLLVCVAFDARSNDRSHGPGHPHRASSIQLQPPVPLDGILTHDVQESIEVLAARPGLVWAITRTATEGAKEIVFDEIPQTADHIQGIVGGRLDQGPVDTAQIHVQFNGDAGATAYNTSAWQFASGGSFGVLPGCGVGVGQIVLGVMGSESQYTFTISDYSWEGRKKDFSAHGWAVNGFFSGNMLSILSGGVRTGSTDAVRSLRFSLSDSSAGFAASTKITVYGLSDEP